MKNSKLDLRTKPEFPNVIISGIFRFTLLGFFLAGILQELAFTFHPIDLPCDVRA